ncbi:MAG: hypothetical protein R2827_15670 [Bdellovibrionales bacterium]
MNSFFKSLSKSTTAFLVIVLGILFIVISDPPKSVCDSQIAQFKKTQAGFMFPETERVVGKIKETRLKKQSDFCKVRNSPGACFELFTSLKVLVKELGFLDSRCQPDIAGLSQVRDAIFENIELMTLLAWGETPPVNYHAKLNWLTGADMKLYCDLKRVAVDFYGESRWQSFREKMIAAVPGTEGMSREEIWNVILLSTKCDAYL